MIGVDYGQQVQWETIFPGETVYMVDFSLQPFSDMERLNRLADLIWIDHHKSAIEEAEGTEVQGILDTNLAACELVWNHLKKPSKDDECPLAIRYLGRYDVWKHLDMPGSLEFQYGMKAVTDTRPESSFWVSLFEDTLCEHTESIRKNGEAILAYERVQNVKFADVFSFEVEFHGLRCVAANRGMADSQTFESVYDPMKHDAMILFVWKSGQWAVSLYSSKSHVDVSVIAKANGGGGHRGAAGFQCNVLPFLPKPPQ
jgi:nanoRNase/pAp phosphatase (c-di-AMP/oligoRNAs hydrolase)